ncbi:hypothetical protein MCOR25_004482 [Pyricularia grisea]|uniref:GP-PDE domain-containing protein n=1 Tax=Pyricularia grisea TaxID=148305 RepID=A0A6P8B113_PYRGI|nr:uncharacterized protein PgNI_06793 [Pyricularia grisea]KAI6369301.1 hypothetical protein MCOR25_004482 [Pyricularia grisea]TLD08547.1 hypothetical protein PgNI_06793 [Pyricularia grisea]
MTLLPKGSEKMPLLDEQHRATFPPASFADAIPGPWGRRVPQAIAHRGYKAKWPENTMAAFAAALAVGAQAIETDLHLTKDKVVVLSHDGTLKRCFGEDRKLEDCEWSYVSTLRTMKSPPSPMPRLADLLHYLTQPGMEDKWLLLDIKRDDDPDELIRRTAETFASVPSVRPWKDRIIMGCWDANYMRRCSRHLPGFSVAYIGWSLPYAWQLLKHSDVSFNLLQKVLVGPFGKQFLRAAEARGRQVFVWTVNDVEWMEWSIKKGGIDGLITDDPELYVEVCRRQDDDRGGERGYVMGSGLEQKMLPQESGALRWTRLYAEVIILQILARILILVTRIRLGSERKRVRDGMRG